jgi:hypothetical protein
MFTAHNLHTRSQQATAFLQLHRFKHKVETTNLSLRALALCRSPPPWRRSVVPRLAPTRCRPRQRRCPITSQPSLSPTRPSSPTRFYLSAARGRRGPLRIVQTTASNFLKRDARAAGSLIAMASASDQRSRPDGCPTERPSRTTARATVHSQTRTTQGVLVAPFPS